jgi:hypothetical protein
LSLLRPDYTARTFRIQRVGSLRSGGYSSVDSVQSLDACAADWQDSTSLNEPQIVPSRVSESAARCR